MSLLILPETPDDSPRLPGGFVWSASAETSALDMGPHPQLARSLGLDSLELRVSWQGLAPSRSGRPPRAELDALSRLVDSCCAAGLGVRLDAGASTPPDWLAERGGFLDADAASHLADLVERLALHLGDRIDAIMPLSDPGAQVLESLDSTGLSARRAMQESLAVATHLLRAQSLCHAAIRAAAPRPLRIALLVAPRAALPASAADASCARFLEEVQQGAWLRACVGATTPVGLEGPPERVRLLAALSGEAGLVVDEFVLRPGPSLEVVRNPALPFGAQWKTAQEPVLSLDATLTEAWRSVGALAQGSKPRLIAASRFDASADEEMACRMLEEDLRCVLRASAQGVPLVGWIAGRLVAGAGCGSSEVAWPALVGSASPGSTPQPTPLGALLSRLRSLH